MNQWNTVASKKEQAAAQRRLDYANNQINSMYQGNGNGTTGGKFGKGKGKSTQSAIEWNLSKGDIYYQAMQDFYTMDHTKGGGARGKGASKFGKGKSGPPLTNGAENGKEIVWICKVCGCPHSNPLCQFCRYCGEAKPSAKGKGESYRAPPTSKGDGKAKAAAGAGQETGKATTLKASANADKKEAAVETEALTKAGKRLARNEAVSQMVITLATSDPTTYLATKIKNNGEAPNSSAKSATLQKDLDHMIASGTFAEVVIDAQRKQVQDAEARETRAAKQAITQWKLPPQANQRLLHLQADIEGRHTRAMEQFKSIEDECTTKIKALRIQLDEARTDKEEAEKAYQEKLDKVKSAIDLLPTAFGNQKVIEEQLEADNELDDQEDQDLDPADNQDNAGSGSGHTISADKVKTILEGALREANLHTNGNVDLQNGLSTLMAGIVNAIKEATTPNPKPKLVPGMKKAPRKKSVTPNVQIFTSESEGEQDVDTRMSVAKRHRDEEDSDGLDDEDNIYPWDEPVP